MTTTENVTPNPLKPEELGGKVGLFYFHDAIELFDYFFPFCAGPESVSPSLLKVVMKPIAAVGENYQYPPVNWAALLSPLMRLNFGKYQAFVGLQTLLLGCDVRRKTDSVSNW